MQPSSISEFLLIFEAIVTSFKEGRASIAGDFPGVDQSDRAKQIQSSIGFLPEVTKRLNIELQPSSMLSLQSFAREFHLCRVRVECECNNHQTGDGEKEASYRNPKQGVRPSRHVLLGFEVICGALILALSFGLSKDAIDTINDPDALRQGS